MPDVVDLRSDTLTVPDAGMRAAMASAEVGDDVWGEDPTVRRLEQEVSRRLGKHAAVYVPSGTMGNLACVAAQTRPGDEVIADSQAHVVIYEAGGTAIVAGVQLRLLDSVDGIPDADAVMAAVRETDVHQPVSSLLCIENTHNRRGGGAVDADRVHLAARAAHSLGLRVHCDGARLFNAAVALGVTPADLVDECDTVTVCVSKGLGAPVGSVVAGDVPVIDEVRRWRKRLGGGMRQAGIIAAAGIYGLEHNIERLAEDHTNAGIIAETLLGSPGATVRTPSVPTNIVLIETPDAAGDVAVKLARDGVLVTVMGGHTIRCVTHLGIDAADARRAAEVIAALLAA
ncbi:MAG TPA: GntG family PLP-dependent aldolase [Candidatus Saccharimonadales bacterium]|nr:GntG family PLP-dependent aldolase [Candidatus Saccharimonadales bacterium]